MNTCRVLRNTSLAVAFLVASVASATVPIVFNPKGTGDTAGDTATVGTFDWTVGNAVAVGGNPVGGLVLGSKFVFLSQSRLTMLLDPNGNPVPLPSDKDFTFVAGGGEVVNSAFGSPASNVTFQYDPTETGTNFFEIWVKAAPPIADMLAGTGFGKTATSTRILYGQIVDMTGNFATTTCSTGATGLLDQFLGDDWSGKQTVCGSGSTDISVAIIQIDPNYFPGFDPGQVANLKAFFNTSTVTPFKQANPSRLFIGNDAGFDGTTAESSIAPDLGTINGGANASLSDFQFQADPNQSFEEATTVAGGCRVTYGGNDKNGNIAPNSFGSACMKVKGNQENCYTFGGQVGAPSGDPALGGPFGEHTHHNVSGPAGDFVFRAGTHSAPKTTRITATACKDPGACRQAEANAGFKQIDFEGTGSFRTLDATATAYLSSAAGHPVKPDNVDSQIYYFRVDMDDTGEPGNKASKNKFDVIAANQFFNADQNNPLSTADPLLTDYGSCNTMADVYQFYICKDATPCEQKDAIYAVRAFLTGGNIQLHKAIK